MKINELLGLSGLEAISGYPTLEWLSGSDPLSEIDEYFFKNCLKKNPYLSDLSTDEVTLMDFLESQQRARKYNLLFDQLLEHETMRLYLDRWAFEVQKIMGSYNESSGRFTSGATTTVARGNSPFERFVEPQITIELKKYFESFPRDTYPWNESDLSVGFSIAELVPKTAKVGRLIAKPLSANAFRQTELQKTLYRRIQRQGIDFTYAQDVHKNLARQASIRNHLTTDDAKWASNLIYFRLVEHLCSPEWYHHLCAATDHQLLLPDGQRYKVECFALMGNGFCFELQTIVFLGLLRTAAHFSGIPQSRVTMRVFGDDLIYSSELTNLVRAIGRNVGFITNVDKSFSEGPFRESCGGDYYQGYDVRPVYLNRDISHPYDITIMANQVYQLLTRHNWELPKMKRVWLTLIRYLYKKHSPRKALWGPTHLECLHGRPEENWLTSTTRWNRVMIKTWQQVPSDYTHFKRVTFKKDPDMVSAYVCGGYFKGYGAVLRGEQKLPKGVFGPPRPSTSYYPQVAAVGSSYSPKVVDTQLFLSNNLVSHDDPLDVFNLLPRTNCAWWIYHANYKFAKDKVRADLRRDLHSLLLLALETKKREIDDLGHLDIQF